MIHDWTDAENERVDKAMAAKEAELVRMQGGTVTAFSFLIELSFLNGAQRLKDYNANLVNLITY